MASCGKVDVTFEITDSGKRFCLPCGKLLVSDGVVMEDCYRINLNWHCCACGGVSVSDKDFCSSFAKGDKVTFMHEIPGFTIKNSGGPAGIERPDHYKNSGKIRDYVVADDWGLPAILAQALKYIKRHRLKGHPVEDLRKAVACVELAIEQLKENDDER